MSVWIGLGRTRAFIDVSTPGCSCFGGKVMERSDQNNWMLVCETCGDAVQFFADIEQSTLTIETRDILSITMEDAGSIRLLEAALLHRYRNSGFSGFFFSG